MGERLDKDTIFKHMLRVEANRANSKLPPHRMSSGLFNPRRPDDLRLSNNYVPEVFAPLADNPYKEFGNCSISIHAEFDNAMRFGRGLRGAHACLYPHPCPNCAKDLITAGVDTLYIDARARKSHYMTVQSKVSSGHGQLFETLTLPMLKAFGMTIIEADPDAGRMNVLHRGMRHRRPLPGYRLFSNLPGKGGFIGMMSRLSEMFDREADWTLARVVTRDHRLKFLVTTEELPSGQTPGVTGKRLRGLSVGKYSSSIDSLSIALLTMAREGMRLEGDAIGSNLVPYPRTLFNAAAAGVRHVRVQMPHLQVDRAQDRQEAFNALLDTRIITSNARPGQIRRGWAAPAFKMGKIA